MNVAIVTQPLEHNYGAILQNFALQRSLKKLGMSPLTIDFLPPKQSLVKYWLSILKTSLLYFSSRRRSFFRRTPAAYRKKNFDEFVKSNIATTRIVRKYSNRQIINNNIDVVVVGSDQVWRPKYSFGLYDKYLQFCEKDKRIKRLAYAASFGVDKWEYSLKQTKICSRLAKKFAAISVREESGVNLCKDNLGVDATLVLDPTLLLDKRDYCNVCENVPVKKEKFLAAFVLDKNENVYSLCKTIAEERGLVLKFFQDGNNASLSISEWLAMFRDASYVVTDSFHGTVFSIIFEKNFKCVYNKSRGAARFESLLKLYESGKLVEMRDFSLKWLKTALEK